MPEEKPTNRQWGRQEIAEKMAEYERDYPHTLSQRQLAEQLDIPRSTLQHWLARKHSLAADPELVAFF